MSTQIANLQDRIRILEQAVLARDEDLAEVRGQVAHLRASLHAHCPNCCNLRWHPGIQDADA